MSRAGGRVELGEVIAAGPFLHRTAALMVTRPVNGLAPDREQGFTIG